MCCLIASFPDLCHLSYFYLKSAFNFTITNIIYTVYIYANISKVAASTIFYTFGRVWPWDSNPQLTTSRFELWRTLYQLSYRGGISRGDRGKMIHFFKILCSCFYDWIYLIAVKCIIHCQVLAATREKEKQVSSDISA